MTRPRIGLVHALHASIAPIEAAFDEMWPEAETVSLYDESLYLDFNRAGGMTPAISSRVERLLHVSHESGAQAILFTGSLFGDAVEAAREKIGIPVLTAYEAMIEEAFIDGGRRRIAVLSTAAGTAELLQADIDEYAKTQGFNYDLESSFVGGAIDALLWGDREEHDMLLCRAAAAMGSCDVLMLAQFSMAPVANRLPEVPGRRVLTSPGSAVAKLKRHVAI